MKHLIVGCGEVGKALMEVLGCSGYDPQKGYMERDGVTCDVMHICIPYSEGPRPLNISTNVHWQTFHAWVRDYQSMFKPTFTIIHSTVPIGVSDDLDAHHSPIRGRHPYLAHSIRTFVKFIGGPDAALLAAELAQFGIEAVACKSARDTEAGKLLDLMQYGASVLIEKEIHAFCARHDIDFNLAYKHFNDTYNMGYEAMGFDQFIRPVLDHHEGAIGGHCVAQNMKWLDSETAWKIRDEQERLSLQKINV